MENENSGVTGVPTSPSPEAVLTAVAPPLGDHQRDLILLDMYRRVGVIDERTATLVSATEDHEGRIRSIEKRQWSVPGLTFIVTILAALGLHPHGI